MLKVTPRSNAPRFGSDFYAAFKLFLSPRCKLPVWDFVTYFASLAANKIPVAKKYVKGPKAVDFSTYMRAYDNTTATFVPYQEQLKCLVNLMGLTSNMVVVDLCSGTGNLSAAVAGADRKVISLDYSPAANAIHQGKRPGADIREANLDQPAGGQFIPLPDQSVDRVCVANALCYIQNRQALYAEIKRILKKDGCFVLAVEARGYSPTQILKYHLLKSHEAYLSAGDQSWTAAVRVYCDFIAKYEDLLVTAAESKKLMRGIAAGTIKVFTEPEIIQELKANGFAVVSTQPTYGGQTIAIKVKPGV